MITHGQLEGLTALFFCILVAVAWSAAMIAYRIGRASLVEVKTISNPDPFVPDLDSIPLASEPLGVLVTRGYGGGMPAPSPYTGPTTDLIARWRAETDEYIAGMSA